MHVQSCCFAVLFFCRSPCRRRYLSSQMAATVTPVLTSQAEVLCYSFLVGGYTNFTFRTFFISTPFKRLVNKQHIDNKLREGLKHFAAYALSRRICPMDFFLILKLEKTRGKKLTSLARVTSFPGFSPTYSSSGERGRGRERSGGRVGGSPGSEWVSLNCMPRPSNRGSSTVCGAFFAFRYKLKQWNCTTNSITSSKVCNWTRKRCCVNNLRSLSQVRETIYTSKELTCIEATCIEKTLYRKTQLAGWTKAV